VNNLVKTEYGYHIIEVTEAKTNTIYKIAAVAREIYPSDNTRNQAFRKADYFASTTSNSADFTQQANADSLPILSAENILPNATFIRGLDGNARLVIRWAFNDAEVGDVSEAFELESGYVIALLTKMVEKGTASLEDVRDEIEAKVKAQEKGKIIANKLKGMSGTLDEIAEAYGEDASVYSTSDLKISDNSLPGVGFDPKAVGKVFALESGQTSEPFIGENGVLIIETQAITEAPEIADYTSYKNQLQQQKRQRTGFEIAEAIQEFANIEDQRYKFY
jgi:peptidyl-prolyl cis-trans isomerase D